VPPASILRRAAHRQAVSGRAMREVRVRLVGVYGRGVAATAVLILFAAGRVAADDNHGCADNPNLVGSCFQVHGRIFAANGAPGLRVWPVGTKRILGVAGESEGFPNCLLPHIGFSKRVYADLIACPFTADKPARMRMVCIESAWNMVVEDYTEDPTTARVYRV